jgi:glycosyltransferase involved in cell wall biosynthesis
MRILFVHQNFPGQYRHLAAALARTPGWQVTALGDTKFVGQRPKIPGVKLVGYPTPPGASQSTHHYVKPLEGAVRRGQAVVRACLELKKQGFTPDIIYAHPGWGEALFLKDIFPQAQLTLYCEFYYGAMGRDVGFDPEFPATLDDLCRVRTKNAASLLSLEAADRGISPTRWQRDAFPEFLRERISVVHEGVETDLVKPDPRAEVVIAGKNVTLRPGDEVVTYVARNLEPYRGYHIFMRALPEIQRRRPNAHILIVGDQGVSYGQALPKGQTYRQKYLDEVAKDLDMSRVHFLGQVPYQTLVRIYQVSSAHVYLTYPFVLSWSLLEAMAAGCPVVASRTPPVEEVIVDGENGFLVDFFSLSEIAERVDQIIGKAGDVDKVRENARKTVVEDFDLKRVCLPQHLELLGIKENKSFTAKAAKE